MTPAMASLRLKGLTKRFGDLVAVDHVNLKVMDGEFMVLLGPSGCGKSTILRLIAGLEAPDEGEIWIGDRIVNDIDPTKRNVAMVFQNYALYPHMSVYHNIEFPLRMAKMPKNERRRKVIEIAELLGIKDLLGKMPKQLSGGQQQRVALARALVREPQVFLLDEPLSNLDAKLRVKMRFELKRLLKQELGITTIYVTHDQAEAMTMADRIAVMNKGRILQVGTPDEVYSMPENTFVAGFVGVPPMNLIKGELSVEGNMMVVRVDESHIPLTESAYARLEEHIGETVTLGIRPHDIDLSVEARHGYLRARILGYENLGNEAHIHFTLTGNDDYVVVERMDKIVIYLTSSPVIYWRPNPDKIYIFDGRGTRIYP